MKFIGCQVMTQWRRTVAVVMDEVVALSLTRRKALFHVPKHFLALPCRAIGGLPTVAKLSRPGGLLDSAGPFISSHTPRGPRLSWRIPQSRLLLRNGMSWRDVSRNLWTNAV
ncbi:hypothetical protein SAMN05421505_10122 [Sinosporangium album]|uniref:Uncharacterized protein n=1 Tax=Sinosporangium album TaxID=504805 RepID=A0A1G7QKE5_9ACTN|nr:hypothetical protein SAMN05421505_10122 [Sinosporangium album]